MNSTRLALAAALTVGLAVTAPVAVADTPHQVDPASVTPLLNPSFAPWTCWDAGTGITCRGGVDNTYDEVTDIPCAAGPIYVRGSERVVMTRWHDSDGRATRTQLHTDVDDRLSLQPGATGPSVQLFAHWQKHYVYPVPGDPGARVLRETGAILRVRGVPGGTVYQDTGFVEYVPDQEYEGVAEMHGVHDTFGGPDLYEAICAGLAEE